MYVLKRVSDLRNRKQTRRSESTNKINEFEYFRRDLVIIVRSTFLISVKVCSFLKHDVHRRFLLLDTAVAHDTTHKVFYRFSLVRCRFRVFFLVSISSRSSTINKNSTIFTIIEKDIKIHSSQRINMRM